MNIKEMNIIIAETAKADEELAQRINDIIKSGRAFNGYVVFYDAKGEEVIRLRVHEARVGDAVRIPYFTLTKS